MKKILSAVLLLIVPVIFCQASYAKNAKKAKKVKKSQQEYIVKDAQYYVNLGADYEWKNNKLGAIGIYSKALEIDPECNVARESRVRLNYFLGRYNEALEDLAYFYNLPNYGAGTFYEYRIDSKKKIGDYEGALDDMFEVILAYGGQARVLEDMFVTVSEHPELEYKLNPASYPELLAKYPNRAKLLRDYAQMYKDANGKVVNTVYYNYFTGVAKAVDPSILLNIEYIQPEIRTAPGDAQVIEVVE